MKPWVKYVSIGVLLVLVAGLTYGYLKFAPLVNTGTGLVAHQVCSCLYVSNRELEACMDDRWPNVERISAEPFQAEGVSGVKASGMITVRTATYEPEFGCTLQD